MSRLMIYKDNYLIEASYKLTLFEQRVMLYCIGKLNPNEPEQTQTILVDDFIQQFPDVDKNSVYKQLKSAIDSIYERSIKVKDPNKTKEFRWIQSKEYYKNEGRAIIEFSNAVMPYLCQLEQQFTRYQLRNVSAFKKTYSIRLYELLTQYRTAKKRIIKIAELRELLQLENKFQEWRELKRKVIDSAIEEINEKSDLRVTYTPLRSGRSFESIEFYIEVDEQIDLFEKQAHGKQKITELKKTLRRPRKM